MSNEEWYVAVGGERQGPWSTEEVVAEIEAGAVGRDAHVYTDGMADWEPITSRYEFASAFGSESPGGAPPPPPTGGAAHEVDYEVFGEEMQFVELTLDPGEACVAEAGSFMYMDPGIQVQTVFGDGSAKEQAGGIGRKLLGAVQRKITGESLFMTVFANGGGERQKVAFAAPYPGRIIGLDLAAHAGTVLCQKDTFLCAAKGISVGVAFQKRLGAGLFGGEGFILQRLEGDGLAFVHAGGSVVERELRRGEVLRLDTGCLVAFEHQVDYDVQFVGNVKTALFGGEGLFYVRLTGPGKVWMQSLPFSRLASRVFAAAPQSLGTERKGEGSVLGGLGDLVMGD